MFLSSRYAGALGGFLNQIKEVLAIRMGSEPMTRFQSSETRLVALLGHPVIHSVSPEMHNAGFEAAGLNAAYLAFDVAPAELSLAVRGLASLGSAGFNLTIPHKEAVMDLLDEIDPFARMVGAVNTVAVQGDRLIGYNTDGPGFLRSLDQETGFRPAGTRAVILGAGGFARAVAFGLAQDGAKSIILANRDLSRAEALAAELRERFPALECRSATMETGLAQSGGAGLVVNCTPVGMHPEIEASPIQDFMGAGPGALAVDSIFNPQRTRFLEAAAAAGLKTIGGLGTLVHQGALAWRHWFGFDGPVGTMWDAALSALKARGGAF